MKHRMTALIVLQMGWLAFPSTAMAYIGPGSGMSAIGVFLALVVGFIVAVLGFLWYPVKRIIRKFRDAGLSDLEKNTE